MSQRYRVLDGPETDASTVQQLWLAVHDGREITVELVRPVTCIWSIAGARGCCSMPLLNKQGATHQWSSLFGLMSSSVRCMYRTRAQNARNCVLQLHYRPAGDQFWMQTSVTPVRENGRVLNHIWVHTDVTEQKVRSFLP